MILPSQPQIAGIVGKYHTMSSSAFPFSVLANNCVLVFVLIMLTHSLDSRSFALNYQKDLSGKFACVFLVLKIHLLLVQLNPLDFDEL